MGITNDERSPANLAQLQPTETLSAWNPLLYKREFALAFVLLIASHIFVLIFAKMAHWELDLTHAGKLAPAQLERCHDGTGRTLNEACQMDCCWYTSIVRFGYDREPMFGGGNRARAHRSRDCPNPLT